MCVLEPSQKGVLVSLLPRQLLPCTGMAVGTAVPCTAGGPAAAGGDAAGGVAGAARACRGCGRRPHPHLAWRLQVMRALAAPHLPKTGGASWRGQQLTRCKEHLADPCCFLCVSCIYVRACASMPIFWGLKDAVKLGQPGSYCIQRSWR